MAINVSVLIFVTLLCITANFAVPPRDFNWPQDICTPFPYPTPSPIDIVTVATLPTPVPSALTITINVQEKHILRNTGHYVTVLNIHEPGEATVEGGFLHDCYHFERANYFWSPNVNISVGGSIDGQTVPVAAHYAYRNSRYPTFEEAIKHRDGLVIVHAGVKVEGEVPNPAFEQFCAELRSIRDAGHQIFTSTAPLYFWTQNTQVVHNYYTYPGAYVDLDSGIQYDCATIIVIPPEQQGRISCQQYEEFLSLKNEHNLPFANILPTVPRGCRPVIRGESLTINSC